jgi:hypothetical protein
MLQSAALLFIAGFLVAGSDGDFFPWANALGLFLTLIGGFLLVCIDRRIATRLGPWRDQ